MGDSDGVEEKKGSGLHAGEGEGKKEGEREGASHPGDSLPLKTQTVAVNSFQNLHCRNQNDHNLIYRRETLMTLPKDSNGLKYPQT